MPADPARAKSLFLAAADLPDPAARAAFLDRECGGDADLRGRVEALLRADAPPGPDLTADLPPDDPTRTAIRGDTTAYQPPQDVAGEVVAGRYKLLEQIGEGGMGAVWMADQTEPVRRRVALKLIRADRGGSRTILARFEAERQAIALMDHPHIAKLLDAGTAADGQPFFVMELVKGVPLTDFCDAHRLTVPDRLAVFRQVCGAVRHAHQEGVIHRDLKPTNILVESHDGKPVPKVIDFGLAKAVSPVPLTDRSLFTGFGSVLGTPLYMAPEQARFDAVDVDTRADVYALGVILYELLTGTTPLTREAIKKAALDEMLRVIREQDPPTPSHRLSTADAKPTIAANRQTEPARLGRFVRGELDWIVMKALSKDRDRRYESATGFAKDVERFLNREPVSAGPPTAGYRARKFVARNKGPVAAAGAVLLALVAGVVGTTLGLVEARRQRDAADTARQAESDRAAAERAANEVAAKRLAQVERGNNLLLGIFADLDIRLHKRREQPLDVVLADRLAAAADQLDGEAVGDPQLVAALQNQLGLSLTYLGFPARAVPLLEKGRATLAATLGPDHPDTLAGMNNLAGAYECAGRPADAVPLFERTYKGMEAKLGPGHPHTLGSRGNLAGAYLAVGRFAAAEPHLREVLAAREKTQPDVWNTFNTRSMLGGSLLGQGRLGEAEPLLLAGYEGMKQRAKTIPLQGRDRLPDAADRLIELYVALNKPDEVKKWRAERAKYPPPAAPPPRPAG
ncbi:MAG: serine/threonine-protein kinase [Gemmataceae bacterium]|nr:serine/threonine-protein kinase [Gemmataceae bacterium]